MVQDLQRGSGRAGFRIAGAKDQACQARVDHGSGAHGAGLNRGKHHATGQAVVPEPRRGLAQSYDLGVRRWVMVAQVAVLALAQDLSVLDDYGAHRHLPGFGGGSRLFHGEFHAGAIIQRRSQCEFF